MKTPTIAKSLALAGIALFAAALPARAASITWSAVSNITGVSDVSTSGDLVYAINAGGSGTSATVNGVTFAGSANTGSAGVFASTAATYSTNSYLADTAPFTGLPSEYRILLQSAIRTDTSGGNPGSFTLTLQGLTVGANYQIQLWINDSRSRSPGTGYPYGSTEISAGTSVILEHNTGEAKGGLGQFVLGSFSATATTQEITFTSIYSENTQAMLTAFQLRDLSNIPEPGSAALIFGACGLASVALRRRR